MPETLTVREIDGVAYEGVEQAGGVFRIVEQIADENKITFNAERRRRMDEVSGLIERLARRTATATLRQEDWGVQAYMDRLCDLTGDDGFTYKGFMEEADWPELAWYLEHTEMPLTQIEVWRLLTVDEAIKIRIEAKTDPKIDYIIELIKDADYIYLSDAQFQWGIGYLAEQGHITPERAARIIEGGAPG